MTKVTATNSNTRDMFSPSIFRLGNVNTSQKRKQKREQHGRVRSQTGPLPLRVVASSVSNDCDRTDSVQRRFSASLQQENRKGSNFQQQNRRLSYTVSDVEEEHEDVRYGSGYIDESINRNNNCLVRQIKKLYCISPMMLVCQKNSSHGRLLVDDDENSHPYTNKHLHASFDSDDFIVGIGRVGRFYYTSDDTSELSEIPSQTRKLVSSSQQYDQRIYNVGENALLASIPIVTPLTAKVHGTIIQRNDSVTKEIFPEDKVAEYIRSSQSFLPPLYRYSQDQNNSSRSNRSTNSGRYSYYKSPTNTGFTSTSKKLGREFNGIVQNKSLSHLFADCRTKYQPNESNSYNALDSGSVTESFSSTEGLEKFLESLWETSGGDSTPTTCTHSASTSTTKSQHSKRLLLGGASLEDKDDNENNTCMFDTRQHHNLLRVPTIRVLDMSSKTMSGSSPLLVDRNMFRILDQDPFFLFEEDDFGATPTTTTVPVGVLSPEREEITPTTTLLATELQVTACDSPPRVVNLEMKNDTLRTQSPEPLTKTSPTTQSQISSDNSPDENIDVIRYCYDGLPPPPPPPLPPPRKVPSSISFDPVVATSLMTIDIQSSIDENEIDNLDHTRFTYSPTSSTISFPTNKPAESHVDIGSKFNVKYDVIRGSSPLPCPRRGFDSIAVIPSCSNSNEKSLQALKEVGSSTVETNFESDERLHNDVSLKQLSSTRNDLATEVSIANTETEGRFPTTRDVAQSLVSLYSSASSSEEGITKSQIQTLIDMFELGANIRTKLYSPSVRSFSSSGASILTAKNLERTARGQESLVENLPAQAEEVPTLQQQQPLNSFTTRRHDSDRSPNSPSLLRDTNIMNRSSLSPRSPSKAFFWRSHPQNKDGRHPMQL